MLQSLKTDWWIWNGKAVHEFGLQFKRKPIRTVRQLMFAKYYDAEGDRHSPKLGQKSLAYLAKKLREHGLRVGQAIPPDDYD